MADSRSIIIDTTTQNGIKKQKSFTDVDPEATAVEMLNFANAAVALTTDTFRAASYVDKEYLSGGSIMKEQLTGTMYTTTQTYPTSTNGVLALQSTIKHANGNAIAIDEFCTFPITVKTYETDVGVSVLANKSGEQSVLLVYIYPAYTSSTQYQYWYGTNQETTPAKKLSEINGAGRIEVTIHDGATYKGFTLTVNVQARA